MTSPRPIFFATERTGRKVAYRWEARQLRSFRMPLAQAEIEIATGQAVDIGGHLLKAPTSTPEGVRGRGGPDRRHPVREPEMSVDHDGTCRIAECPKPAEPGELCRFHASPPDPDLERESMSEADGEHRRIG